MSRGLVLVFVALLLPAAEAGWGSKGAYEPDNRFEATNPWFPLDPDVDPNPHRRVVYFNGFGGVAGASPTALNPNSALLQTSLLPMPYAPLAILGIWKDCNRDGFVGLGDNALLEYRAELLVDRSVCPPRGAPAGAEWTVHNDGQWVVELVPIGYDDVRTSADSNPVSVNDTAARVWADWGLPGAATGLSCPIAPLPAGTFRSTGGLVRTIDCFTGFRVGPAVTAAAGSAGMPEIGFGDAPPDRPDQSASPLNQPNPWGSEEDGTMATVFDCRNRFEVVVLDPLQTGLISEDDVIARVVVSGPALILDPEGSPAGTVNETQAGATDCDRANEGEVLDLDGHADGSDAELPYALEGSGAGVSPFAKRTRPDHTFRFDEGARGKDATSLALGPRSREHAGAGTVSTLGLWSATSTSVTRTPFVARQALGPEPVLYLTYYAHVSPAAVGIAGLQLPRGSFAGFYGLDGCFAGTFECDPAAWWRGPKGEDITPRDAQLGADPGNPTAPLEIPQTRIGVRIGQPYELRDIDCIDSSARKLADAGLHWGVATGTRCDRP